MILRPAEISNADRYRLLIGTVLPRPIAWVSSLDAEGRPNLAPFSYFTVACSDPMTLLFCPQMPAATGRAKDTLRNVRERPEFVVNICDESTVEAMNATSAPLPPGRSEFEHAGVVPAESVTVFVPRVAAAPVAYECRLQRIVDVGEGPGSGSVVFGEVLCVHIRDALWVDGKVPLEGLRPVGRLAGNAYARVTDVFELRRPD